MRKAFVFIVLICLGCSNSVSKKELSKINGYWEIEKVILSDGTQKEYQLNAMVDYFMLQDTLGFRKKVQPLFDGTFDTSDDAQSFVIQHIDNKFALRYTNDLSEWTERIEVLNEASLILSNEAGVLYHYKKFESIKLSEE